MSEFVRAEGTGPPVVPLHDGVLCGDLTWQCRTPLARRWRLVVVRRAGHERGAGLSTGEDAELDAALVTGLLGDGAHLVGQPPAR